MPLEARGTVAGRHSEWGRPPQHRLPTAPRVRSIRNVTADSPLSPPTKPSPVHIIGGGLAGLAAAVGLCRHGVPVVLLEARDRLGGRASSFVDPESGATVDNCQHVGLGCCTNWLHFCRTIGVAGALRVERRLTFLDPEGRASHLQAALLPAPLHLVPAFTRLKFLTWEEKRRLAWGLWRLARLRPEEIAADESFADWLRRHGQTERLMSRFWEVVLVSALSESLDRMDVGHARKVFVDGFLRHRRGWEMHVPTVPLDELYGTAMQNWLRDHGGEVRFKTAVRRLEGDLQRITALELRSGERLSSNEVILAVPQHRLLDLLPPDVAAHPLLRGVSRMESAPITSLHLWFDRPLMPLRQAVLIGRLSQWIFARPAAGGAPSEETAVRSRVDPPARYGYQVVISASRSLRGVSQEEVRDRVLDELAAIWPAAREARVRHWRMVTEQRAVFSVTPGIDALRPPQQSPTPNLQLAGDWTATGWPATMESAVRSGYLAAQNVLRRRGLEASLLQPDLPSNWWTRLWLGLRRI